MESSFNEKFRSDNGSRSSNSGSKRPLPLKKRQLVDKSQVKQMINSVVRSRDNFEWNYYSTSTNASNTTFTGTTYQLTDIPQGDTDSQRGGDSVSLHSLEVNYGFYASTQANACRVILYQWLPGLTAGSPPSATSLLLTTGSALSPFSPYNVDNYQQFHVLYDKTHSLSPYETPRLGNIKITKFPKKSIQYTSGSASGSSKLFLLVLSDDGVASYPTFSYVSKLYFVDA
jgi:hypothetical protein